MLDSALALRAGYLRDLGIRTQIHGRSPSRREGIVDLPARVERAHHFAGRPDRRCEISRVVVGMRWKCLGIRKGPHTLRTGWKQSPAGDILGYGRPLAVAANDPQST